MTRDELFDRMTEMLRSLEWVEMEKPPGLPWGDWLTTDQKVCMACWGVKYYGDKPTEFARGHEPDCRLAALLKALP